MSEDERLLWKFGPSSLRRQVRGDDPPFVLQTEARDPRAERCLVHAATADAEHRPHIVEMAGRSAVTMPLELAQDHVLDRRDRHGCTADVVADPPGDRPLVRWVLADLERLGREGGDDSIGIARAEIEDEIQVTGESWLAVDHGRHRARDHVPNVEVVEGNDEQGDQVRWLHRGRSPGPGPAPAGWSTRDAAGRRRPP